MKKPWIRGVITLGILSALAAGLMLSPVSAAAPLTKAKVKKIAKQQANKVFNSKIGSASVANAAAVNGLGIYPLKFQTSAAVSKQVLLDLNGLQLKADCNGTNTALFASTSVGGGKLAATSRRVDLSFVETEVVPFDPADGDVNLSPGQTPREMHGRVSYIGGDGRYVSVLWNAEGTGTGPHACNIWGMAFA
jgi:hypothetical protein